MAAMTAPNANTQSYNILKRNNIDKKSFGGKMFYVLESSNKMFERATGRTAEEVFAFVEADDKQVPNSIVLGESAVDAVVSLYGLTNPRLYKDRRFIESMAGLVGLAELDRQLIPAPDVKLSHFLDDDTEDEKSDDLQESDQIANNSSLVLERINTAITSFKAGAYDRYLRDRHPAISELTEMDRAYIIASLRLPDMVQAYRNLRG